MIGVNYEDLLNHDIRFYDNCVEGFISRRETEMNDLGSVGHVLAGKVAQAVWANNTFSKPLETFRLRPESGDEKVLRTLRAKGLI